MRWITRTQSLGAVVLATLAMVLGACGSSVNATQPTPTSQPALTPRPTVTSLEAGTVATTIAVGTTSLGNVLVDAEGRTLYLFKKDRPGKASDCAASCAAAWPPVETTGSAIGGPGIDASKLGSIIRPDGSRQVTYAGWPLYRHAADAKPGDTTGERAGSEWYVVSASGSAVPG